MNPNDTPVALPVEALAPSDEQIERLWRKHCHAIGPIALQDLAFARAVLALAPPAVLVEPAADDVSEDLVIEVAEAMQVRRILEEIKKVAALHSADEMPTPFQSAWALCCEEIFYRATGEKWHMDEDGPQAWAARRLKNLTTPAANESSAPAVEPAGPSSTGKVHELKTDSAPFQAMLDGLKPFEIRNIDRDFQPGDTLLLRETRYGGMSMFYNPELYPLEYTGRELRRFVTRVLKGFELECYGVDYRAKCILLLAATPSGVTKQPAPTEDSRILLIALDLAYSLLNAVVEQNGTLPKALITDIRKMLPPRFPKSFTATSRTGPGQ